MPMRQPAVVAISWILPVFLAIGSPLHAGQPQDSVNTSPQRTFTGPDGKPLPFKNDAEVIDFMLKARVVNETTIGSGINRSQKVTLEKDGVRANAIFRETDETTRNIRVGDKSYRIFRDSYLFEPAAYHLALRLGITNIPPAVLRRVGSREGSMQIWIEDTLDEESESFKPPDVAAWIRQVRDMILFDNFIYNVDRNGGNMLVTPDYKLFMIDHTRGFQEKLDIMDPEHFTLVNEDTWERFQSLTNEEIRDAVRPYLSPTEMTQLVHRHQTILDYINKLIKERGRAAVVVP